MPPVIGTLRYTVNYTCVVLYMCASVSDYEYTCIKYVTYRPPGEGVSAVCIFGWSRNGVAWLKGFLEAVGLIPSGFQL